MRQFRPLEGDQQYFFVLFAQESLFCNAGHSARYIVLVFEMSCPLHIIKELSTLDNNFAPESVLEKCVQKV